MKPVHVLLIWQVCLGSARELWAQAAGIVIPVPAVANGNSASTGPFSSFTPIRYQEVYGAAAFSQISTGGGWITHLEFPGAVTGGFGIISNIQITLCTTPRGPDGLSTIFADNAVENQSVVFGPGRLLMGAGPRSYAEIDLSHPFFYDPNLGNLLMDVQNFSGMSFASGGMVFELEEERTLGDAVSSLVSSDANGLTGTLSTSGLVTDFIVTPAPEPSILTIGGLAVGMLLVGRYIQKTKTLEGKGNRNGVSK